LLATDYLPMIYFSFIDHFTVSGESVNKCKSSVFPLQINFYFAHESVRVRRMSVGPYRISR